MNQRKAILFDDYLQHLACGGDPVAWLADHPAEGTGDFRALGELVVVLEAQQPDLAAVTAARSRSRRRFFDASRCMAWVSTGEEAVIGSFWKRLLVWLQTPRWSALPAFARVILLVILVAAGLMGVGSGVISAASDSLPGDPLYGLKRANERMQLVLLQDQERRARLEEDLSSHRADEVSAVLERAREVEVDFEGPILELQPTRWVVGRFVLQVTPQTVIQGQPVMGSHVEVHAHALSDQTLTAQIIEVEHEEWEPGDDGREYGVSELVGVLMSQDGDIWMINGQAVQISAQTKIEGAFALGMRVEAEVVRLVEGSLLALEIESVDEEIDPVGIEPVESSDDMNQADPDQNTDEFSDEVLPDPEGYEDGESDETEEVLPDDDVIPDESQDSPHDESDENEGDPPTSEDEEKPTDEVDDRPSEPPPHPEEEEEDRSDEEPEDPSPDGDKDDGEEYDEEDEHEDGDD